MPATVNDLLELPADTRRELIEFLAGGATIVEASDRFGLTRDAVAGVWHRWLMDHPGSPAQH